MIKIIQLVILYIFGVIFVIFLIGSVQSIGEECLNDDDYCKEGYCNKENKNKTGICQCYPNQKYFPMYWKKCGIPVGENCFRGYPRIPCVEWSICNHKTNK